MMMGIIFLLSTSLLGVTLAFATPPHHRPRGGAGVRSRRLVVPSGADRPRFASTIPSSFWGQWRGGAAAASAASSSRLHSVAVEQEQQLDTSSSTILAKEEASDKDAKGEGTTTILALHDDFVRPDPDSRQYRAIRLANNLEVLLVSSPESDVEAGAIHVQAGHMDDPADRPGLAHFHEHMLFLGTEKYPEEHEYEAFLNSHGGHSNAYTDMEDTNYYFSVTPHSGNKEANDKEQEEVDDDASTTSVALSGALDRLAQFFISPLFDQNMVERELRAIDSEYRNSFTSDAWRNYQLLKASANQQHPFAKFGCGNYNTLTNGGSIMDNDDNNSTTTTVMGGGTSPQADLLEFWKTYYPTTNMRLCVVGRANLDALQRIVEDTFGKIPKSTKPPRRQLNVQHKIGDEASASGKLFPMEHSQYEEGVAAFGPAQLNRIREVVPLLETRAIKIQFAVPPLDDPMLKQSRPYRFLSHLLGHESPGSLHALLNEEGLVTGLSSGAGLDTSDFGLFSLALSLTPKGMKQKDRVLDLVFQWIALISKHTAEKDDSVLRAYHDELRQISDTNFKFRENGDPTDFCSTAADLLFHYEPSQLLVGSAQTGEYDPVIAKAFIERLRPDNAMITILDSDLGKTNGEEGDANKPAWQKEKWYGAKYREMDIPKSLAESWVSPKDIDPRLHLPALNEYVPSDFSLRCDDDKTVAIEKMDPIQKGEPLWKDPPHLVVERPDLRMWHKMDRTWRVPKTSIKVSLLSPNVYRSPRTMTLNRIYQRVLNDDLNSFVYDAGVAGCSYRVSCVPTGYRISVSGYSEKLPFLLDTLTSRMLSLIEEMKQGEKAHPALAEKFRKAQDNLLRETKNYRLDSPYEVANYNSRLLLEESVWYIENYVAEMEGEYAQRDPLTMEECACVAEESLLGRVKAEALCTGNINEAGARQVADVIDSHFLKPSRPLSEVETPLFKSLKLPTRAEAVNIFGPDVASLTVPIVYQEVASSESEENNAVELNLQAGCELDLGYRGIAMLELIAHIGYNSAYNQLRTKEQLGYIVSAFSRKTVGGAEGFSVLVQSSVALPEVLQERCEAWLVSFRKELEEMSAESIAMFASAVVAQLLERDTKLSQEISRAWGEILLTESLGAEMKEPAFDRLERLAAQLRVADKDLSTKTAEQLKQSMLDFFDKHFTAESPERRAMSSRVYNHDAKKAFEQNVGKPGVLSSYEDIRRVKQFLSSWPVAPYWRKQQPETR